MGCASNTYSRNGSSHGSKHRLPRRSRRGRIWSDNGLYLTGEDNLRLTCISALAGNIVVVEGRLVTSNGERGPDRRTARAHRRLRVELADFPRRRGLLTQVQIRSSSAGMLRGQTFAILEVIRGREGAVQSLGTLLQGYVTTNWRLAWPGAALESSLSGRGKLRYIGGNNPAAGAEISESVPAGVRWLLKTFTFVLVASAAAANRSPILTIDDGATVIFETGSNVLQIASQTSKYRAGAGVPLALYDTRAYHLPLPPDLWLGGGSRIRTVTGGLDVGDDYAAPIYLVEEFIE
jgi:hypothetical protein